MIGMLVVERIAKIRRAHRVHGNPIKEICRGPGVSWKVVRKALRSDATEFRYERKEQPLPRIGPWQADLDRLLEANEGRPARDRLTLIRIFEDLRGRGYEGGYDAVRRYARSWQRDRASTTVDAYVPLSFAPGEAYQFDWRHEIVLLGGTTVTVKVAHTRLCHRRMLFVRAYPRETQEMVLDAHDRGFAFFKGACTRGIYDNTSRALRVDIKTAVGTILVGRERAYNRRFQQICSHYLVDSVGLHAHLWRWHQRRPTAFLGASTKGGKGCGGCRAGHNHGDVSPDGVKGKLPGVDVSTSLARRDMTRAACTRFRDKFTSLKRNRAEYFSAATLRESAP